MSPVKFVQISRSTTGQPYAINLSYLNIIQFMQPVSPLNRILLHAACLKRFDKNLQGNYPGLRAQALRKTKAADFSAAGFVLL